MLYLGWVFAAFLLGVLITAAAAVWLYNRRTLYERFSNMGSAEGKDLAEIVKAVKASPREVETRADGRTLRTWREGDYAISLLFDRQDYCLGVMEERS